VVAQSAASLWERTSPGGTGPQAVGGDADVLALRLGRGEELERKVAELEQANRHLAAVAADVAHDLRSPLQAVSGFAELLARREGARLDETSQSFLAHVLSATHGMRELVEAVLEHRRSSSALLDVTRFDCTAVVTGVILRLGQDLDNAGAHVVVEELPFVHGDRVQLGRVFQNLVANAIRATPRGRKPLWITARRRAAMWEFRVTDDGVGVADVDRERIFERFERGLSAANDGAGKGMGLAICRTIVERHGGYISVEEAPGGGSRFSFTLPDDLPAGATRV
jgi:chemotaxis family two-component system sensor kinase Cph1